MEQSELSKKEEYDLKKSKKEDAQSKKSATGNRGRYAKNVIIAIIVFGAIGYIAWLIVTAPKTPESEIISRNGFHWHPQLEIYIKGEKQEIPSGIGLGAVHNPMHTHDADGIIHMEFSGLVKKDNARLGEFFKVWNKRFDADCIFDFCNGTDGTVQMFINGEPNTEFENYVIQEEDKIEIRFE